MLQIDKVSKKPYYVQVYEYFKAEIESGRMRAGTKLPSIRALAMRVGISKLTVERAYFQLSNEGYIQGRSKTSGVPGGGETSYFIRFYEW